MKQYNLKEFSAEAIYDDLSETKEDTTLISLAFGKNGHGLTNKLALINDIISYLSNYYKIYINKEYTFIDDLDDVYELAFMLIRIK